MNIWEKVRRDLLKFNVIAEKLVLESIYWIRGKKETAEMLKDKIKIKKLWRFYFFNNSTASSIDIPFAIIFPPFITIILSA